LDPDNLVVKLCIQITRAEFAGHLDEARRLALLAWQSAQDDYERCMAAHYIARYQEDPNEKLRWDKEALQRAENSHDERVKDFMPSLFLNMGRSYEKLGDTLAAHKYYALAAELGVIHQGEG
jgi:hypothetical protein